MSQVSCIVKRMGEGKKKRKRMGEGRMRRTRGSRGSATRRKLTRRKGRFIESMTVITVDIRELPVLSWSPYSEASSSFPLVYVTTTERPQSNLLMLPQYDAWDRRSRNCGSFPSRGRLLFPSPNRLNLRRDPPSLPFRRSLRLFVRP